MIKTWLVSDTHFGHNKAYTFLDDKDRRIRPWAENAEEGDAFMECAWNTKVKPEDKIYHLGDVAIPRRGLKVLERLNGRKILIRGNHDLWKLRDLTPYFENIMGSHKLENYLLTHIPVHVDSLTRWSSGNIHGHLHANRVRTPEGDIDKRYINVSVEHTYGFPIDFDEIKRGNVPNYDDLRDSYWRK